MVLLENHRLFLNVSWGAIVCVYSMRFARKEAIFTNLIMVLRETEIFALIPPWSILSLLDGIVEVEKEDTWSVHGVISLIILEPWWLSRNWNIPHEWHKFPNCCLFLLGGSLFPSCKLLFFFFKLWGWNVKCKKQWSRKILLFLGWAVS